LNLFSSFNTTNGFLAAVAIFSTAAWGLGYFGQPHIIVRFMALRSPSEAKTARRIGISWMVLTAVGAIVTALVGIAYFAGSPEKEITDPETVFLLLSQIFFHPFVAGLVLAAVLAAIMSTMSSQLIVCSSALVEDLYNIAGKKLSPQREVMLGRSGVLIVAIVAAALALNRDSSILDLVSFAWAGFGAAFGPIVLLSLYWRKLTSHGALAGMLTGAVTVFVWGNIDVLASNMYEIVPGFVLNLIVAVLVSRATYQHNATIEEEFTAMEKEVEENAPYVAV
jgi:sodium/proline symporter